MTRTLPEIARDAMRETLDDGHSVPGTHYGERERRLSIR